MFRNTIAAAAVMMMSLSVNAALVEMNSEIQGKINLATNCASNCESCWDQCTTSDNCGVGYNCSTTPCGNRCIKQ